MHAHVILEPESTDVVKEEWRGRNWGEKHRNVKHREKNFGSDFLPEDFLWLLTFGLSRGS